MLTINSKEVKFKIDTNLLHNDDIWDQLCLGNYLKNQGHKNRNIFEVKTGLINFIQSIIKKQNIKINVSSMTYETYLTKFVDDVILNRINFTRYYND